MRTKKGEQEKRRKATIALEQWTKKQEEAGKLPNPPPRPFKMVATGEFLAPGTVLPDFMTGGFPDSMKAELLEKAKLVKKGDTKKIKIVRKKIKMATPAKVAAHTKIATGQRPRAGVVTPHKTEPPPSHTAVVPTGSAFAKMVSPDKNKSD